MSNVRDELWRLAGTIDNCTCALREREKDTIADRDFGSSPLKVCVCERRLVEPKYSSSSSRRTFAGSSRDRR